MRRRLPGSWYRSPLVNFAAVGLVCTLLYAGLYAAARQVCAPVIANLVALALTMAVNFLGHRHITFRDVRGSWTRQAASYMVAYLLGLGVSSGLFAMLVAVIRPHALIAETLIGVASGLAATIIRYVLMSRWVFVSSRHFHIEGRAQQL